MHTEEVVAGYLRVVGFVYEVAGGEVDGGQVRGEAGDVHAEKLLQALGVRDVRGKLPLTSIGADEERAAAAGRVHHALPAGWDGEAVDEIHHLDAGIVLPEFVSFLRGDQPLDHVAYDLIVQAREVEFVDFFDKSAPEFHDAVVVERHAAAQTERVLAKDGLVVVRNTFRVREEPLEVRAERVSGIDMAGNVQRLQRSTVAFEESFVKDEFVGKGVASLLGRPVEVVAYALRIINDGEAQLAAHPFIYIAPGCLLAVTLEECVEG